MVQIRTASYILQYLHAIRTMRIHYTVRPRAGGKPLGHEDDANAAVASAKGNGGGEEPDGGASEGESRKGLLRWIPKSPRSAGSQRVKVSTLSTRIQICITRSNLSNVTLNTIWCVCVWENYASHCLITDEVIEDNMSCCVSIVGNRCKWRTGTTGISLIINIRICRALCLFRLSKIVGRGTLYTCIELSHFLWWYRRWYARGWSPRCSLPMSAPSYRGKCHSLLHFVTNLNHTLYKSLWLKGLKSDGVQNS